MKALFFLSLVPTVVFSFYPLIDDTIQQAVDEWIDNRHGALAMYGHISKWDTGLVNNMRLLFHHKATFNDDISRWKVHGDMFGMFYEASAFNQDISDCNVAIVWRMESMCLQSVCVQSRHLWVDRRQRR